MYLITTKNIVKNEIFYENHILHLKFGKHELRAKNCKNTFEKIFHFFFPSELRNGLLWSPFF